MELKIQKWNSQSYFEFSEYLKSFSDSEYKDFHSRLLPDYPKEKILGVRLPKMREIAREISKGSPLSFLSVCKSDYYEEIMIRGIVTGLVKCKSFDEFSSLVDSFVGLIDNWAVNDSFCSSLKQTKKFLPEFFEHLSIYLKSENPWHIRFAVVMMMTYYLDDTYIDEVLKRTDSIKSEHYYVKMAQAWLVATALAKQCDKTLLYLDNSKLDDWTFNKAIQKARESYRIDKRLKETLNQMKRKNLY